tara:strand:- start:25 stop:315 length:291 start_codon:yes stop_codon:yes gene_type:complete
MKKGPFKMKKSPAKHTGMDAATGIGMLGGVNNSVVGGSASGSNPMVGMLGGRVKVGNTARKSVAGRNKRKGMGAYNMFKRKGGMGAFSKLKNIFGF